MGGKECLHLGLVHRDVACFALQGTLCMHVHRYTAHEERELMINTRGREKGKRGWEKGKRGGGRGGNLRCRVSSVGGG
jgi:hypothetical protein